MVPIGRAEAVGTLTVELWVVAFELREDGGSGWPRAFVLGCGLVSRRANGDGDNGFDSGRRKRSTD